jgi:hypothetical protein
VTDSYLNYYYWGIDLPGTTRSQASALLDAAKLNEWAKYGSLVDPSQFLTLHLDKQSVEMLLSALQSVAGAGLPEDNLVFAAGIRAMIEELQNWTAFAATDAPGNPE